MEWDSPTTPSTPPEPPGDEGYLTLEAGHFLCQQEDTTHTEHTLELAWRDSGSKQAKPEVYGRALQSGENGSRAVCPRDGVSSQHSSVPCSSSGHPHRGCTKALVSVQTSRAEHVHIQVQTISRDPSIPLCCCR